MECRVGKGSDDGDGGVRNEIEGLKSWPRSTYPAEQLIHVEHRWKGSEVKSLESNRGAPNRGQGGDRGAPILEEERQQKRQNGELNKISRRQSRLRSANGE